MRNTTLAIVALCAACSLISVAPAQGLATSVIRVGDPLPSGPFLVENLWSLRADRAGAGYAVVVDTSAGSLDEVWTDPVDDGTTAPQLVVSIPRPGAYLEDMHEGHVVWRYDPFPSSPPVVPAGVYVDGTLAFETEGPGPVPGSTRSGIWTTFEHGHVVRRVPGGDLVVMAELDVAGQRLSHLLRMGRTTTVLLREGDPIPGLPGESVTGIQQFQVSPDGTRLAARVTSSSHAAVLLVDGEVADLYGAPLLPGAPVPPELAALTPPGATEVGGVVYEFGIADDGDWTAEVQVRPFGPQARWAIRNGRVVDGLGQQVKGVAVRPDGAPVITTWAGPVFGPFGPIRTAATPVDSDRDGIADPGWSVPFTNPVRVDGRGVVYGLGPLPAPGAPTPSAERAVTRVSGVLHGVEVCPGAPNSTGLAGKLLLVGDRSAAANALRLGATQLPVDAFTLPVVSATAGFTPNPGGSAGDLCLAGAIGRFNGAIASSGPNGTAETQLDLTALPLPTGFVAAAAGETWHFQVWYRDTVAGAQTSNFTAATAVTLR